MRFAATKLMLLCCEVAHVCQNRFRNCEIPCGMGFLVRNQTFPLRNAFRSCQMKALVLRSGTRVPKSPSQLRKFSQRTPKCCGMVLQHSADFAEAAKSRNALFFCSVFALFLLRFRSDSFPFNFLAISSTWDHSKRLKHT